MDILPAIHALTGHDTSKVGSKCAALQAAEKYGYDLLHLFGKTELDDVEKFLLMCISQNSVFENYSNKIFQFEKFPPTIESIKLHILRSYFQCHQWLHASYIDKIGLDPLEYGSVRCGEQLVPLITIGPSLPEEFLMPCNCVKCAKANVCPCRVKNSACCNYCKCQWGVNCKNSSNLDKTLGSSFLFHLFFVIRHFG